MALATFKGGVHPYEGKELSRDIPVKSFDFDGDFVYPMSQGLGAPSKPIVKPGDPVLVGQKIAEPGGFIGAVVTSSVSGVVKAIEPRLTSMGSYTKSIIVTSDGKYEAIDGFGKERRLEDFTREKVRDLIKEAGIIGMGGAGFPTHVKLTPKDDDAIDFIIANGSECEPMLTNDYRLMIEEPEKVIGGMKVVLSLFPHARGIIAIESNKPEAIKIMKEKIAGEDRLQVMELRTKYPEGGERQLIYAVTGRMINSSMLPADAGCIVDNVATLSAINDAVLLSTPMVEKTLTLSGDAFKSPANVKVRLGVSFSKLIEAVGGFKSSPGKMVVGGPMMGMAVFSEDIPVMKNSSGFLAFIHDEVGEAISTHCIRCGRCLKACPEFLAPVLMAKACEREDFARFEELGGMECMECGSCSWVCPAKRPLTQLFKRARREVQNINRAKRAAEAAKKAGEEAAKKALDEAAKKAEEEAAKKAEEDAAKKTEESAKTAEAAASGATVTGGASQGGTVKGGASQGKAAASGQGKEKEKGGAK